MKNALTNLFIKEIPKVIDEDVEYYRKNAEELELMLNKEVLQLSTPSCFFRSSDNYRGFFKGFALFFEDFWGKL